MKEAQGTVLQFVPAWWHKSGLKMKPGTPNALSGPADLFISNGVTAQLWIHKRPSGKRKRYLLDWRVLHAGGFDDPHTGGRIEIDDAQLAEAFNLSRFSDNSVITGKFVRQGDYLNIPGKGYGEDGDANLSVFLSDAIKEAVHIMLSKDTRKPLAM